METAEDRYKILVAKAPVCIHEIGLDGNIQSMNDSGLNMVCALNEDAIIGVEYLGAVADDDRDRISQLLDSAYLGTESKFKFNGAGVMTGRSFASCFIPLFANDGTTVLRIMGISEDITENVRAMDELKNFAYAIAHDLKAPVRNIAIVGQWISEAFVANDKEKLESAINHLHRATSQMSGLIDGLLRYTLLFDTDGQMDELDVGALAHEIIDQNNQKPSMVIDNEINDLNVVTNRYQLSQVLTNVISNSVMHHGSDLGRITVKGDLENIVGGQQIVFSVSDDGVGIPKDAIGKVFGLLETANPRSDTGTSGLGLAIVKRAVEANRGQVSIANNDDAGCTVSWTWPCQELPS